MTLVRDLGPAEYHGRPVTRFGLGDVWIEALAQAGPRIVRLGLGDGANLLAETPDLGWDKPEGRFELLGGHRLWYAPETLGPDQAGGTRLGVELLEAGVRLIGERESSGLRRTMEVRKADDRTGLTIRHEIANEGGKPFGLAIWPITQLPLGGIAIVPQPRRHPQHAIVANRLVALWPYSSWQDPRLTILDGLIVLRATPGDAVKVGCLSHAGAMGYLRDDTLFVKRFDPAIDEPHADFGCNAELYADAHSIEVESLGPHVRLAPGSVAAHTERWEIAPWPGRVPDPADEAALRDLAERVAGFR